MINAGASAPSSVTITIPIKRGLKVVEVVGRPEASRLSYNYYPD